MQFKYSRVTVEYVITQRCLGTNHATNYNLSFRVSDKNSKNKNSKNKNDKIIITIMMIKWRQ